MPNKSHSEITSFIWGICNLLRGPYKRNEYRKVILPLTVLRRFDTVLAPTKAEVLKEYARLKGKSENIINAKMRQVTDATFYNISPLTLETVLNDTNHIAINLRGYIKGYSPNVREIFERFDFDAQISRMHEKNLLFNVLKKFVDPELDLSTKAVDNIQMGYVFEELIRIGAEQSNEEAGEHFTPREVIKLMVNLLFSPAHDMRELRKPHIVVKVYDPACGTGGMLSEAEKMIRNFQRTAQPHLFGQDLNDEAWAVCRADMLIKGENSENIKRDCSFEKDGYKTDKFDYMLANPPFGVEWKQQQKTIEKEHENLGYDGRFGAGLPRINDGSLLFLQHMLSKMRLPEKGGSRIGIVFNGSPLFTGDAGSGESDIRQWIIENDWLEAIVALPDQLFYNTGISTYVWVLTNRKEKERKGKIQLIDARNFFIKMRKSLGNKRNQIGDGEDDRPDQIGDISRIYGSFQHNEKRRLDIDGAKKSVVVSKIFDNADFGYNKIVVERPLRLNFQASSERMKRLEYQKGFEKLVQSDKKKETVRLVEIAKGRKRQKAIRSLVRALGRKTNGRLFKSRIEFLAVLKELEEEKELRLSTQELKVILDALAEKDQTADICVDAKGQPEPDADLRDTENIPLKEDIEKFFRREVLPHVPDAWIDHSKTKIGYEIPLNRHFYRYEPPRALEEIESDIRGLESEIVSLLAEVTGSGGQ
jgi:type I restriction enzyme M protein